MGSSGGKSCLNKMRINPLNMGALFFKCFSLLSQWMRTPSLCQKVQLENKIVVSGFSSEIEGLDYSFCIAHYAVDEPVSSLQNVTLL